jgi:hypothetical protein
MPMRANSSPVALVGMLVLAVVGCEGDSPSGTSVDPDPSVGNATLGATAFVESCAECHSSRDAFDLAFFSFPDSTIIRRAVFHVDSATAHDIATHVRGLHMETIGRGTRVFQPGSRMVAGDVAFATALFGADEWPTDLTTAGLLAIDPLKVSVAVPMPLWSDEATNRDWMPDQPLSAQVMEHSGGAVEDALAAYYANPGLDRLIRAVRLLRRSQRENLDGGGVCQHVDGAGFIDPVGCFEARRWTANLVGQHMLRAGLDDHVHPDLHDAWWDVGNVARRTSRRAGLLENREENWAAWMYLGWMFDPGRHASIYTGLGLVNFSLDRHATFVALRSQVARPIGSPAIYNDVDSAANFAPPHWAFDAVRFGLTHILERISTGDIPRDNRLPEVEFLLDRALNRASLKVSDTELTELVQLRDEIVAALP